jgi:hypothetical protein
MRLLYGDLAGKKVSGLEQGGATPSREGEKHARRRRGRGRREVGKRGKKK